MRLLAIEDDPVLADGLQVGRVEDALAALESSAFDAVVLDLGLPDGDGLSVLRFVRERDMDVGVVVLSARDDSRDRIVGLDAGADDYVGKPFDLDELAARIRSALRRGAGHAEPEIEILGVRINPATKEVEREGRPVQLSAREYAIVAALLLD